MPALLSAFLDAETSKGVVLHSGGAASGGRALPRLKLH